MCLRESDGDGGRKLRDVVVFVSIGDAEKLRAFLDVNPDVPPGQAFVDGYDREAYAAMGLELFTETDPEVAKDAAKSISAPDLGGLRGWWDYARNVVKLAPVEKDKLKLFGGGGGVPEGVLQLGATFVVKDDRVVYAWKDPVPGVTAPLEEIESALLLG